MKSFYYFKNDVSWLIFGCFYYVKKNVNISARKRVCGWTWFYGVAVSTLDFESSDPSSNLGRTCHFFPFKTKRVQEYSR